MATFITTIKFTQQGIKDIDHSTKRAAIFTGPWATTTDC